MVDRYLNFVFFASALLAKGLRWLDTPNWYIHALEQSVNWYIHALEQSVIVKNGSVHMVSFHWYIHALEQSVIVKNGNVHMVSFPVTFLPKHS